jgi:hypothetical protein
VERLRTCMKVGLLPANIHRRVNTKAARPKMTGINAVGRSISRKGVVTVFESTNTKVVRSYAKSNAIVGIETDIKGEGKRENQETGNKLHMFVKLTANNPTTTCSWHSYKEFT